jgi:hypothetical protein
MITILAIFCKKLLFFEKQSNGHFYCSKAEIVVEITQIFSQPFSTKCVCLMKTLSPIAGDTKQQIPLKLSQKF